MASVGTCLAVETVRVYHRFAIEVGRGMKPVRNLRYLYGDLGWRMKPIAEPLGALSSLSGVMLVPDEFEISWETEVGQQYEFKIPVRASLPSSAKGKTVLFVIMADKVEGYLGTPVGLEDKLERFY